MERNVFRIPETSSLIVNGGKHNQSLSVLLEWERRETRKLDELKWNESLGRWCWQDRALTFFSSPVMLKLFFPVSWLTRVSTSLKKTSKSTSLTHSFYSQSIVTDEYNVLHKDDDKGVLQRQRLSTFCRKNIIGNSEWKVGKEGSIYPKVNTPFRASWHFWALKSKIGRKSSRDRHPHPRKTWETSPNVRKRVIYLIDNSKVWGKHVDYLPRYQFV